MKVRKIVYVLILSLAFNCAFSGALLYRILTKQDDYHDMEDQLAGRKSSFRKELKLSPEQMEKFKHVRKNFHPKISSIRDQLMKERKILAGHLASDEPDSIKIESSLKQIANLQIEIERKVIHHLLKEREFLSAEQKQEFIDSVIRRMGVRSHNRRKPIRNEKQLKHRGRITDKP
jgi:Spy/CpxP family protein refolding chaperone